MAVIHIIRAPATPEQIAEMRQVFDFFIKLAVDVERAILAGGGEMHADCEDLLLQDGSEQKNIWGRIGFLMMRKCGSTLSSISVRIRIIRR